MYDSKVALKYIYYSANSFIVGYGDGSEILEPIHNWNN